MSTTTTSTAATAGSHRSPTADDGGAVRRFVRRHPLGTFFGWFFTIGQALAFAPVIAESTPASVPRQTFIVASTLIGLLLPALVITRIVDGPAAMRGLLRRSVAWRRSAVWYLVALLAVPLVALLLAVAVDGVPPVASSDLASALLAGFVMQFVLTTLPNNLWEEVAWTGFVTERLQRGHSAVVAALVTGPLFAVQHVSLVVGNSLVGAVVLLGLLAVLATPFRFLTGWVYNRTGSLFLVGLLHGAGNAVAGGSGFGEGLLPRLYPGGAMAFSAHLVAFAVLGLIVLAATRGRLGRQPAPSGS